MDFLRRIGRFIGGAAQNVGRAVQQAPLFISRGVQDAERARQQAIAQVQRNLPRFQAPQPPRIQLPPIQIPRVQAPKVDFGAVSRALQGVGQGLDITKRTAFGQQLTPQQQRLVSASPQLQSQIRQTKAILPTGQDITKLLRASAPAVDIGLAVKEKGLGAFSAQERMQRGIVPAIQQQVSRTGQRLLSTPEGQMLLKQPGFAGQIGRAAETAAFRPQQAITGGLQSATKALGQLPGVKQIGQTKPGKIISENLIDPTLQSFIKNLGQIGGAQAGQKTYAKGLQGEMQNLADIVNIGSLFYSGNLAKQLGTKGTSFFSTAAKLAPRLWASGTGQDLITQLSEGKKPNEIDWKRALLAGGAYTTFGIGIPGVTRGGSKILSKAFGSSTATKAAQGLAGVPVTKAAQGAPVPRAIAENVYPIRPGVTGRLKPAAGSVVDATPGLAERAQQQFAKSKKISGEVATGGLDATFQLGTPGNIQKYILDAKGNPVGGVLGFYEGPNRAILRNIYVLPGQRGQGAATKLIKAFEEEARINGISEIKLASKADKLYKSLGYKIDTSRAPGFETNYFTKTLQPPKPIIKPQQAITGGPQLPQKPIYETVPKSAMEPKVPKGEVVPQIKQSSQGNIYIKTGKNEIVRIPKTIQKDIYDATNGVIPTPERRLKANTILNKNGLEMTVDGKITNLVKEVQAKPAVQPVVKPTVTAPTPKNEVVPPKSSVQTVIDALAEAKPIRGKQEALYAAERAKRAARVAAMGGKVQGEKGFFAQLGQLKGELPKAQFEGIRKQITQPVVDDLFNQVEKSNISVFEKITAKQGLAKLLGAEGGVVPTRGELALLNEIFPKELTEAILAKRTTMQKLGSISGEILNLPRSIMSTVDLSAPFRQGIFLIGRPKQWIPALGSMLKYATSEKAYKGLQAELRSRPTYQLMRQSKLALTDIDSPLLGREEAFMSNLAEKIPGFGVLARGSDRAYTGFLNKVRADVFDDLVSKSKQLGVFNERPQVADDIANFVNAATGRGKLPNALEKSAVALNGVFFSPRLMASRLNLLNPVYYVKLDPFVRKEALKSLFTFAATGASILGLTKAAGADVGVDPRSSDFGKIKIGNTRYDPWGGFQQYMVLASRLLTGEMISSTTGKQMKLGESFKDPTRLDIIQRFLESKQAPIASFVTGFLKGKTSTGENFNLPAEVADRFMPMMTQDMYDLYKEYGPKGLAMGIPGIFGFGSQTYQDQIPLKTKTKSGKETITWRQAPSLGEELLNKITGKQITNVPQEQIASLQEQKKKETQYKIDLDKVKAQVLESGESQTIFNPVKNNNVEVYLKDGVVTTKDIKPTKPKIKVSKAPKARKGRKTTGRRGGRARVAKVKLKPIKTPRVTVKGLPKVPTAKAKKVSFKTPKPKATARKSIKIKTG